MKRLLLVVDALNPSYKSLGFGAYIANLNNCQLDIVFLENFYVDTHLVVKHVAGMAYVDWDIDEKTTAYIKKQERIMQNIKEFESACEKHFVRYEIIREHDPKGGIVARSRYSDAVIIDADISFKTDFEGIPSKFVRHFLENTECPVLISQHDLKNIDEIVFAFDEKESSVFALKQFTYLFPTLRDRPVKVVHASSTWDKEHKASLHAWLKRYYNSIQFKLIEGRPEDAIFNYMLEKKNSILVTGAYGRGIFSNFMHHSTAERVIRMNSHPIFIAHK